MAVATEDLNVTAQEALATPAAVKRDLPASAAVRESVAAARRQVTDILARRDHRLLAIVGPCSIHDPEAARDYAARLRRLADATADSLCVVMRAYFEKPRTTVGWKGLINDPDLDEGFDIERGIRLARRLLLDVAALGLPLATEALDPITPQYLQDLIAWSAIGARTTESQTHREMASGLSSAVGFKNGTDGSLAVAVNALRSVASRHRFLGVDGNGQVAMIHTRGNRYAHIVLRGGSSGPNYDAAAVRRCEEALAAADLASTIMVDCAHANADKDHRRQAAVANAVASQIAAGNRSIVGLMLESNIRSGNQSFAPGSPRQQSVQAAVSALAYGVSITDACIGWEETDRLLRALAGRLRQPLRSRLAAAPRSGKRQAPSPSVAIGLAH